MARAHYGPKSVLDEEGRPLGGALAYIYEHGTTTLISETMYVADDPDTTTLSNPITTDANGNLELYLTDPKRFTVKVVKGTRSRSFTGTAMKLEPSTLSPPWSKTDQHANTVYTDDHFPLTKANQNAQTAYKDAANTFTGAITLPGAPTVDLHAATKKYVDDSIPASPVQIAEGSYTGDGTTNRTIALAFTPKIVVLAGETINGTYHFSNLTGGTRGARVAATSVSTPNTNAERPAVTTNGFIVSGNAVNDTNTTSTTYRYLAIG